MISKRGNSSGPSPRPLILGGDGPFFFVTEHTQSQSKSHAMRQHWRCRRRSKRHENSYIQPVLVAKSPTPVAIGVNNAGSDVGGPCYDGEIQALEQQKCRERSLKRCDDKYELFFFLLLSFLVTFNVLTKSVAFSLPVSILSMTSRS